MQTTSDKNRLGSAGAFVRSWLVLALGYVLVKFAVDIAFGGVIDLRALAFWELLIVPLGQALLVQAIRQRVGRRTPEQAGGRAAT